MKHATILSLALVHSWRTRRENLGLLLESERTVCHLFGIGRQHGSSVADRKRMRGELISRMHVPVLSQAEHVYNDDIGVEAMSGDRGEIAPSPTAASAIAANGS